MSGMTAVAAPSWLDLVLGVVLRAAAALTVVRMVVAWRTERRTELEVDVCHGLMGVSMAGMLIPATGITAAGVPTGAWIVVWSLVTAWFAFRTVAGLRARHGGHHLPHLVLAGAMVWMLAHPMGSPSTLDIAFLGFAVAYAVVALDRVPLNAALGAAGFLPGDHRQTAGVPMVLSGWAAAMNVVMAGTMATMLVMQLA